MKHRFIILSMLVLGLTMIPSIVTARTAKTGAVPVSGEADFDDGLTPAETGFRRWADSGGRNHLTSLIGAGNFALMGKHVRLRGKWSTLWSVVILDAQDNGRIMGTFNVTTQVRRQDMVVWEGHFIWEVTNGFSSGFLWATGSGPFEGKILELNLDEDELSATEDNPNPNIYLINGVITEPPLPQ